MSLLGTRETEEKLLNPSCMVTSAGTLGLDSSWQDFGPALAMLRVRGYEVQLGQRTPNTETTVDTQASVLSFIDLG